MNSGYIMLFRIHCFSIGISMKSIHEVAILVILHFIYRNAIHIIKSWLAIDCLIDSFYPIIFFVIIKSFDSKPPFSRLRVAFHIYIMDFHRPAFIIAYILTAVNTIRISHRRVVYPCIPDSRNISVFIIVQPPARNPTFGICILFE